MTAHCRLPMPSWVYMNSLPGLSRVPIIWAATARPAPARLAAQGWSFGVDSASGVPRRSSWARDVPAAPKTRAPARRDARDVERLPPIAGIVIGPPLPVKARAVLSRPQTPFPARPRPMAAIAPDPPVPPYAPPQRAVSCVPEPRTLFPNSNHWTTTSEATHQPSSA